MQSAQTQLCYGLVLMASRCKKCVLLEFSEQIYAEEQFHHAKRRQVTSDSAIRVTFTRLTMATHYQSAIRERKCDIVLLRADICYKCCRRRG